MQRDIDEENMFGVNPYVNLSVKKNGVVFILCKANL